VDGALATVSDLLSPNATYPGRNFYQQQHANGRGWWDWPRSPASNDLGQASVLRGLTAACCHSQCDIWYRYP